jgi:hypothetical protein
MTGIESLCECHAVLFCLEHSHANWVKATYRLHHPQDALHVALKYKKEYQ